MGLFLQIFLPFLDVDAPCGIDDSSTTQIVGGCGNKGSGNGMDCCVVAVQVGDGETEAGVMGEPDEVMEGVEGDFRDFVEDDAGVVGVIDSPLCFIEADEADNAEISSSGYPFPIVDIYLQVPETVAGQWRVIAVIGRPCVSVEACQS